MSPEEVHHRIAHVPVAHALHWCNPSNVPMACACCGCVNSEAHKHGITYEDWYNWRAYFLSNDVGPPPLPEDRDRSEWAKVRDRITELKAEIARARNEALEEAAQLADEDYSTWALANRIRALKREQ